MSASNFLSRIADLTSGRVDHIDLSMCDVTELLEIPSAQHHWLTFYNPSVEQHLKGDFKVHIYHQNGFLLIRIEQKKLFKKFFIITAQTLKFAFFEKKVECLDYWQRAWELRTHHLKIHYTKIKDFQFLFEVMPFRCVDYSS